MGIKINVQSRNDYSFLFSSMNKSNNSMGFGTDFFSNYASIKNGSYGKLLKAYYSESKSSNSKVKDTIKDKVAAISKDDSKTLTNVKQKSESLKKSAADLMSTGKNAVLQTEDQDKIYAGVSDFVNDYNSMVKSGNGAFSSSINSRTQMLTNASQAYSKALSKIGITINQDNTLSLDKDTFMKADIADVKNLFQGNGSYASRVASQSALIGSAANQEAAKANTYTMDGTYGNAYNVGNLFNSMF